MAYGDINGLQGSDGHGAALEIAVGIGQHLEVTPHPQEQIGEISKDDRAQV